MRHSFLPSDDSGSGDSNPAFQGIVGYRGMEDEVPVVTLGGADFFRLGSSFFDPDRLPEPPLLIQTKGVYHAMAPEFAKTAICAGRYLFHHYQYVSKASVFRE